jgi:hypothetical protein
MMTSARMGRRACRALAGLWMVCAACADTDQPTAFDDPPPPAPGNAPPTAPPGTTVTVAPNQPDGDGLTDEGAPADDAGDLDAVGGFGGGGGFAGSSGIAGAAGFGGSVGLGGIGGSGIPADDDEADGLGGTSSGGVAGSTF